MQDFSVFFLCLQQRALRAAFAFAFAKVETKSPHPTPYTQHVQISSNLLMAAV